jgi:receptor protein-tyrosine kinase
VDLHELLRIVRERWALIALATLVAVGLAALYSAQATPQYKSTARLFVSTSAPEAEDAYRSGSFTGQRVKSYVAILSGQQNARRVIERLDLEMEPRELANRTTASVEPDTVVLTVSVTASSAAQAQLLTQTTAEVLIDQVSEVETQPGKTTAPVKASIVDAATKPQNPYSPRTVRNILLAVAVGLLLGGGVAVMREMLDTRVRSLDGLRRVIGEIPLLGNIQFDKSAVNDPMITGMPAHSPRVEAYRVLRTNLQFLNPGADSKVYAFTSALPAAGKSTTVSNLMLSIAETGTPVLLLEGDLRRPKATEHLHVEGTVGVTTVLIGSVDLDDAIQPLRGSGSVLASGAIPPNPAELLGTDQMAEMLTELRKRYSVILIDTPPVLPVTDAAVIASQSDGAILIVEHGSTTREQIHQSIERLEAAKANVLGVVINRTPKQKGTRGYGYGYGYGGDLDGGRRSNKAKKSRWRRRSKKSRR